MASSLPVFLKIWALAEVLARVFLSLFPGFFSCLAGTLTGVVASMLPFSRWVLAGALACGSRFGAPVFALGTRWGTRLR